MSKYCAIMREKQDFKLLNKESLKDVLRGGSIQTLLHVVFAVVNIKYIFKNQLIVIQIVIQILTNNSLSDLHVLGPL